jgi:hypothetical protein
MKEAAAEGKGAVSLDGRLIDAASIRMAENLLAKLEQIDARAGSRASGPPRPSKAELEERRASGERDAGKPDLGAA